MGTYLLKLFFYYHEWCFDLHIVVFDEKMVLRGTYHSFFFFFYEGYSFCLLLRNLCLFWHHEVVFLCCLLKSIMLYFWHLAPYFLKHIVSRVKIHFPYRHWKPSTIYWREYLFPSSLEFYLCQNKVITDVWVWFWIFSFIGQIIYSCANSTVSELL